jgi:hypothetical protein
MRTTTTMSRQMSTWKAMRTLIRIDMNRAEWQGNEAM